MAVKRELNSIVFDDLPLGSIFLQPSTEAFECMKIEGQSNGANIVFLEGGNSGILGQVWQDDTVLQVTRKFVEEVVYASRP